MAACPRGSLQGQFLRDLEDSLAFNVRGRALTMDLKHGAGSMVFGR
jgi:hypothetical protein